MGPGVCRPRRCRPRRLGQQALFTMPEMGEKEKEGMQEKQGQAGMQMWGGAGIERQPQSLKDHGQNGPTALQARQHRSGHNGPALKAQPLGAHRTKNRRPAPMQNFWGGISQNFCTPKHTPPTQSQGVRGHYIMGEKCLERPLGHFSCNTP